MRLDILSQHGRGVCKWGALYLCPQALAFLVREVLLDYGDSTASCSCLQLITHET